jgi:hypothetical protein
MENFKPNPEDANESLKAHTNFQEGNMLQQIIEAYNKKSEELKVLLLKLESYAHAKEQLHKIESEIREIGDNIIKTETTISGMNHKIAKMQLYEQTIEALEKNSGIAPMELDEIKNKMAELKKIATSLEILKNQSEDDDLVSQQ